MMTDGLNVERSWRNRLRERDVDRIVESLAPLPAPSAQPVIVVMSGLPGTGKSFIARRLAEPLRAVVLSSDRIRKLLIPMPEYTEREHRRVFPAMYDVAERLIERGISVIHDATNLRRQDRRPYQKLARDRGLRSVIVRTTASPEVIRARLVQRAARRDAGDYSDADWRVYEEMLEREDSGLDADVVVTPDQPADQIVQQVLARARDAR